MRLLIAVGLGCLSGPWQERAIRQARARHDLTSSSQLQLHLSIGSAYIFPSPNDHLRCAASPQSYFSLVVLAMVRSQALPAKPSQSI